LRGGSSHENPAASTKVKAVSLGILACMMQCQIFTNAYSNRNPKSDFVMARFRL
jgi:hypothetical protein